MTATPVAGEEILELQNVRFVTAKDTTFEQDMFVMEQSAEAGLTDIQSIGQGNMMMSKTAMQAVITAYSRGKLFSLLSAVLVREGEVWSIASAAENAEFFRTLTHKESKVRLQATMVSVILAFFVSGDLFSKTSLNSSSGPEGRVKVAKSKIAVQPTSGNGGQSSDASPEMTPVGTQ